jgi:two-component system cell cycle sensor histidine kinase/response regulator CckA
MPFPDVLRTAYARSLNAYLSNQLDMAATLAALKPQLPPILLQDRMQLAGLHHEALAALLEEGNLSPSALMRAGDLLAALQAEQFQSLEKSLTTRTWHRLFDHFPLPVWSFDPQNLKIEYGNVAALELYGCPADEWVGMDVRQLATTDTAVAWQDYLVQAPCQKVAMERFTQPVAWRHQTKAGVPISVHLSLARLELCAREFCVAVAEETFGRQQREEQFRRMQRLEAIGQLTSGVAHNFNNILSVIQGYAEMIGARSSQLDARLAKQRSAILTAAKRGAELVRQLMIFSRKSDSVALVQDINPVVAETAVLAERILSARVTFTRQLHPEALFVSIDAGQLSQCLLNLIVNARDAMPEGGLLTVKTTRHFLTEDQLIPSPERIRACATPPAPGDYAVIAVSDTGVGMSAETRHRLFEPFFTTKPAGKGTGLGLAAVYGCVTEAGGFIEVESKLGLGTTFHLFLPMAEADPSLVPRARLSWRPTGNYVGLTALVVEDEPDLLELVCEWLTDAGFKVLSAQTAEEALHQIVAQSGKPIHLLITDDILPEGGGQRVFQDIAREYPNCRCILMSGSFGARDRATDLPLDTVFLAKPFSENELLHAVKQVVTEKKPE